MVVLFFLEHLVWYHMISKEKGTYMKNYAKALMLAMSIGFLSAPISYAQTDTIDTEIGLQNVEKVDAEFLKSCVKTENLDNGGKRAKEVLRSVYCDDGDQNTSYYYYQLYPDVPTFLGKENSKPLQGYFNAVSYTHLTLPTIYSV